MKLTLTVKPNAKDTRVERVDETELKVWVKAQAKEGKANEAVVAAVADYLGIPKSRITIVKGLRGKKKVVEAP